MQVKQRSGLVPVTTPNWKSDVQADYEFDTVVVTAHDGSEQRSALRQSPRTSISFSSFLTEAGVHRHMGDLAANHDSLFTLPTPWRWTRIAGVVGPVITLSEVPFWLGPGVTVILESDTQQEIATVDSVAGFDVTLSSEPGYSFSGGDRLWHASTARAQDKVSFDARTNTVFEGGVQYDLDPGRNVGVAPPLTIPVYEGRDIWAVRPNWQSNPRFTMLSQRSLLDHGRGLVGDYNPVAYHTRQLRLGYTFTDSVAAEEFLAFYLRCQGKRASFWMPTWTADLTAKAEAARNVEVAGTEVFDLYNGSPVYTAIYFAGQVNRINSMEVINSGSDTRLVMADSWGTPIPSGTRLSWCPTWRWATDKLTVEWKTNSVAEVSTTFQTLSSEVA